MSRRIPQEFIHSLLAKVDIVDVIGGRIKIQKKGANHMGCCPFHHEKTASFSVSQSKQFYYCFGCAASGNAIGFLMEYDSLSFFEAVEELAHFVGLAMPELDSPTDKTLSGDIDKILEALNIASHFYQAQLRSHSEKALAVDYFKARGLSGETAAKYHLGFAPKGWDNLMKEAGPDALKAFHDAGLVIKNEQGRHYDRFRGRVMFPIRDRRGRVVGFGARAIEKEDQPKYLNSPETAVFHKGQELFGLYELRRSKVKYDYIIVTEGYMDVIGLSQCGIENAVATLGTATTKTHIEILTKHCAHIVFCYDGDQAGREAAWRALNVSLPLMTGDWQIDFLLLPDGEDPDSLVSAQGAAAFEGLIKDALPLSQFLLDHVMADYALESIDSRASFVKAMLPYCEKIPDGPFLDLLLNQVARLGEISLSQLGNQLNRKPSVEPLQSAASPVPSTKGVAEYFISWILQHPELALTLEVPDLSKGSNAGKVIMALVNYIRRHPGSTTGSILAAPALSKYHARLSQLAAVEHSVSIDSVETELLDCLKRLVAKGDDDALTELIEKSRIQALTDEEKQKIDQILRKNR